MLKAYKCPAGVWTIGYGHTHGVTEGLTITEQIADELLKEDLKDFEKCINDLHINLRQNQFDALVALVFNIGTGRFQSSTLRKKLAANATDQTIAKEFKKWVYAGGKVLQGLINRRNEEAELWLK